MKKIFVTLFFIFLALVIYVKSTELEKIDQLKEISEFSFAIFSDNKGDSPYNSKIFARMVRWIKYLDDIFVIGLGDHIKKGWNNSFIKFVQENRWWNENFYPNIADGENGYYGWGQANWGAGGRFLTLFNMDKNAQVKIRKNGCEYYLKRKVGKFTIHLIQLHFPDSPKNEEISFKEDSKEYVVEILQSIKKTKYDIVIVAAHSRKGFWDFELNGKQLGVLLQKADLVLSATTHIFKRKVVKDYGENAPLFINTGSITYPMWYSEFGFIQINVLTNPNAIVLQYINTEKNSLRFADKRHAFVKIIGGKTYRFNPNKIKDFKKWKIELANK